MYIPEEAHFAVYVQDGKCLGVFAEDQNELYSNADAIQEIMIRLTKNKFYAMGKWMWCFSGDCTVVEGGRL